MSLGCHYAELGTLIAKFTPAHFSNKVKTSGWTQACTPTSGALSQSVSRSPPPPSGWMKDNSACARLLFRPLKVKLHLSLRVKPIDTSSWRRRSSGKRDLTKPPETLRRGWTADVWLNGTMCVFVPMLQYRFFKLKPYGSHNQVLGMQ